MLDNSIDRKGTQKGKEATRRTSEEKGNRGVVGPMVAGKLNLIELDGTLLHHQSIKTPAPVLVLYLLGSCHHDG